MKSALDNIQQAIGNTPAVALQHAGMNLVAKLEFLNLGRSIKARPAYSILRTLHSQGRLRPDTTLIESTSGNFGVALATMCDMLGVNFVPVIDPNINPYYESQLQQLCRRVIKVTQRDDAGGYLKTRIRAVQEQLAAHPHYVWVNQYENPSNMDAHYQLTGAEVMQQCPDLDYLFIAVSTGGTLAGVSRRIKECSPRTRIIAVDQEGSMIFQSTPKARHIPGMGSSMVPALVAHAHLDDVVHVSEADTVRGCEQLFHDHGLCAGGSSGAVYHAIQQYIPRTNPPHKPKVLFFIVDSGVAYQQTIYNPAWVEQTIHERAHAA